MAYRDKYITYERYQSEYKSLKKLYIGFVIGYGYCYTSGFAIQPLHMKGYSPSYGRLYGNDSHYILGERQIEDRSPEAVKLSLQGLFFNGEAVITVEQGMTLSYIARLFDVSVDELVRWNNIENPNKIYVGQKIRIYKDNTPSVITSTQGESKERSKEVTFGKRIDNSTIRNITQAHRIPSPKRVDPKTVGRNFLKSHYIGADNPKDMCGNPSYALCPKDRLDALAMMHDKRYYNINAKGFKGLVSDPRAIGADWQFVAEAVYLIYTEPEYIFKAGFCALVIGIGATYKTYKQVFLNRDALENPNGMFLNLEEIYYWYQMSNVNKENQYVTDMPDPHDDHSLCNK